LRREPGSATASRVAILSARFDPVFFRRLVRYGCVGIAASLFYSLCVIACVWILPSLSPTFSSIIAFIISVPMVYLGHAKLSFWDRPFDKFQPVRFAFSTTSSFIVAIGGMYWITEIAGHSYLLGIAWNWLTIPAMNFLTYMFWVFRAAQGQRSR